MKAILCAALTVGGALLAVAEEAVRDARAVEQAVSVQILLDRAGFGPGKIDGRIGDFTKKALDRYRKAKGLSAPAPAAESNAAQSPLTSTSPGSTPEASASAPGEAASVRAPKRSASTSESPEGAPLPAAGREDNASAPSPRSNGNQPATGKAGENQTDVSDLDLASVAPVYVNYTVTEADVQAVGHLPATPEAKAQVKWLPYASVAEAVAERFHMDLDFLEELNPGKVKGLKAGDVVRVVNVEPFELSAVKDFKPGSAMSGNAANAEEPAETAGSGKAKQAGNNPSAASKAEKGSKNEKAEAEAEASTLSIVISKDENMLEVFDSDRMIAAFPVTVGSAQTASPIGEWKIERIAKLPEFRWDEKMLKEGERSEEFHMLPPGPNNPVGVLWIALNKKGIGVHGTDNPDAIGRNASHGCIRLANWDVMKLAALVKPGVAVSIR